jgi:PKD repeat protein
MNADGSGLTNMTAEDSTINQHPSWSPKGNKIAFLSDRENDLGTWNGIYLMNPDGSAQVRITPDGTATYGRIEWSPDARKLVFRYAETVGNAWTIATMNVDGLDLNVMSEGRPNGGASWSPFLDGFILPQSIAEFSADQTEGPAPLQVQFTNESIGDIDSWSWDFGDSQTSTEQSPSHAYTAPGTYNVSLTVSGPGGTDTETKAAYIIVSSAGEVVPFLQFPLPGRTPWNVTINSVFDHSMTSQYTPDNVVVAYTGEKGEEAFGSSPVPGTTLSGFKKAGGGDFTVNRNYSGGEFLFYDGHPGFDFSTTTLVPDGKVNVLAAASGTAYLGDESIGKIQIDHGNGYRTNYIHLSQRGITDGQDVSMGDIIGVSGDTGAEGHPHLHFSVERQVGQEWVLIWWEIPLQLPLPSETPAMQLLP